MKTDAAVQAAIGLAYMTAKADEALPVSAESVVALVVEAVEHAESILRGGADAPRLRRRLRRRRSKGSQSGGERAAAAVAVLEDCETQCEARRRWCANRGDCR